MPRVTHRDQYKRHLLLREAWTGGRYQSCFGTLNVNSQWKLHTFYRPSEALSRQEFFDHLKEINKERPQLRYVAGKLFQQFERALLEQARSEPVRQAVEAGSHRRLIVVRGVARPQPDMDKLVRALIALVEDDEQSDQEISKP